MIPSRAEKAAARDLESEIYGREHSRPAGHPDQRATMWTVKVLRRQVPDPSPEQRLWFAVIENAVREAYGGGPETGERRENALAWLASEAFDEVVALLGLHPHRARDVVETLGSLAARAAGDGVQRSAGDLPSPLRVARIEMGEDLG